MSGHGGGGSERWLVSYADFITLLMVLFVVLYSMGQVDVQKYKQLAESLKVAFAGGGPEKVVDAGINSGGGSGENETSAPIVIPGIPKEPATSTEVAGRLTDMLALSGLGGEVSVQNNIEGVLISLSEKLTFVPGTAQLQDDAYPVLDTIANMLTQLDNEVRIIGYTDNTIPVDKRYTTNWELSTGRAVIIAKYLMVKGVAPQRILVAGRGEFKPIFANDTPEHRALNSRAEIIVVYSVSTDIIDVNLNINP
ncbi:MAG: OmpA family protein [Anaerolineales bacterium]|nr:OmpA family protein [Anaerolineales bacterium]